MRYFHLEKTSTLWIHYWQIYIYIYIYIFMIQHQTEGRAPKQPKLLPTQLNNESVTICSHQAGFIKWSSPESHRKPTSEICSCSCRCDGRNMAKPTQPLCWRHQIILFDVTRNELGDPCGHVSFRFQMHVLPYPLKYTVIVVFVPVGQTLWTQGVLFQRTAFSRLSMINSRLLVRHYI